MGQPRFQGLFPDPPPNQGKGPGNEVEYGSILSVEQKTIVGNVNLSSNRDYNHDAIIMIYML